MRFIPIYITLELAFYQWPMLDLTQIHHRYDDFVYTNFNHLQFFITLAPTPWLDGKHTIFGRVVSGLSVCKRMGLIRTDSSDRPIEPLKIIKAVAL